MFVCFFCIIIFIFISLCNVSIISTSCLKSKLYASNNHFGYTKYSWNQPKNEFSMFCIMWPKMKKKSCSICQKLLVKSNTSKSISRNPFFSFWIFISFDEFLNCTFIKFSGPLWLDFQVYTTLLKKFTSIPK